MVFCGVDVQLSIACATDERPGVIDETPISVDHLDSAFHRAICDHVPMRPVAEAIASDTRGSAQDTVLAQRVRSIRNQLKATKRSEDNRHAIYYRKWTDTWTRVFTLPVPEHLRKPDDPPQDAAHYDPLLEDIVSRLILTVRRRLE